MDATVYDIQAKQRANATAWVHPRDFTAVSTTTMPAHAVLEDPSLSLYCLDLARQQFLFVETPADVDLSHHPFFFQAQFEHAQRLVGVPIGTLHQLSERVNTQGAGLVLLYSVGRCGSTLLSELFNQQPQVASLSEPDVFTELLKMRTPNGSRDDEIRQLIRSSLIALMKPLPPKQPTSWAIKFRSYGIELADLIQPLFPASKPLFMYRNAVDWAKSTARAFQKMESEKGSVGTSTERTWARRAAQLHDVAAKFAPLKKVANRLDAKAGVLSQPAMQMRTRFFPALRPFTDDLRRGDLSRMEYITLEWVSGMCRYLTLRQQGITMPAFRYEDLIDQPEPILSQMYAYVGWPQTAVSNALPVFSQDSQRGTSLARTAVRQDTANVLTDAHLDQLHALLKKFPEINTADVILPGTIGNG